MVSRPPVPVATAPFTFDESLTPAISSLFPTMGQSGTNVTIRGQGFSGSAENLQVLIGGSECAITYSSATELHCQCWAPECWLL